MVTNHCSTEQLKTKKWCRRQVGYQQFLMLSFFFLFFKWLTWNIQRYSLRLLNGSASAVESISGLSVCLFFSKHCERNRKRKGRATMKVWEEGVIVRLVSKCIKRKRIMRKLSRNITLSEVYFEKYFLWRSNCCCIPPLKRHCRCLGKQ